MGTEKRSESAVEVEVTNELISSLAEHDPISAAELILHAGEAASDDHLRLATQLIGELPFEKTEYIMVSLNMSDLRPAHGLRWDGQREELADQLVSEWERRGDEAWAALAIEIRDRPPEVSPTRRKWLWNELMRLGYQRAASTKSAEELTKKNYEAM